MAESNAAESQRSPEPDTSNQSSPSQGDACQVILLGDGFKSWDQSVMDNFIKANPSLERNDLIQKAQQDLSDKAKKCYHSEQALDGQAVVVISCPKVKGEEGVKKWLRFWIDKLNTQPDLRISKLISPSSDYDSMVKMIASLLKINCTPVKKKEKAEQKYEDTPDLIRRLIKLAERQPRAPDNKDQVKEVVTPVSPQKGSRKTTKETELYDHSSEQTELTMVAKVKILMNSNFPTESLKQMVITITPEHNQDHTQRALNSTASQPSSQASQSGSRSSVPDSSVETTQYCLVSDAGQVTNDSTTEGSEESDGDA